MLMLVTLSLAYVWPVYIRSIAGWESSLIILAPVKLWEWTIRPCFQAAAIKCTVSRRKLNCGNDVVLLA